MTDMTDDAPPPRLVDPENPAAGLTAPGIHGKLIFLLAIAFSAWQLYTAAFTPVSSIVIRSVHVGFLLLLTFALFRIRHSDTGKVPVPWYDWTLGVGAFVLGLYHWLYEGDLIQRAGDPSTTDIVVGCLVIALLFEAARRVMGWSLPIMCIIFIPYCLYGRWLPEPFTHRGFDFAQVIDQMYLGTEGIYGVPTFVSATYIFLFIMFGAFLEKAGMIALFNDVSMGTVGHAKGGPAKVAVISSGFMGMINGSGVANVLTVGQFTIPLMKRFGYRPAFAGAVEATASMGGQIMPPVMGAVAFIMAETLGVPYSTIATAAIIPALLYFGSAFWMVHLEAGKYGLVGLPKGTGPSPLKALKEKWHLVIPLAALVYMLFHGFTPLFAGITGLGLTAIIILGNVALGPFQKLAVRVIFWVSLGVAGAAVTAFDILPIATLLIVIVAALVVGCWFVKGGRATLHMLLEALSDGAKSALGVGVACALVGLLIGATTLTGLASDLARIVLDAAGNNLFLALVLTMIVCIILGTGLPTIPNYIITAAMAGPALLKLGVPLIVTHMFTFYFGIMADLTPPVALAALAASSIAKAGHMEIGWIATRIAIAGYVVPFMAVYAPELMLQGDNVTVVAVSYILFKAVVSIGLWGGAATGYLFGPLNWIERGICTLGAFLLVAALPATDEAGFAVAVLFLAWHLWRNKRAGAIPA